MGLLCSFPSPPFSQSLVLPLLFPVSPFLSEPTTRQSLANRCCASVLILVQVRGREEGRLPGLVSVDSSRRRTSRPILNSLSSANILGQSSGSSRRVVVSSSSDAFVGAESNIHTRTAEASPGAAHRILSGQRSSPIGSSDPKRVVSCGRNASHVKNYDTALGHEEFAVRE